MALVVVFSTGGDDVTQLCEAGEDEFLEIMALVVVFSTGGDDVTQLCDAGEDEFLEIMALVGMAAKPLHVRRLQKALQEYVTNPGASTPSFDVDLKSQVTVIPTSCCVFMRKLQHGQRRGFYLLNHRDVVFTGNFPS